jgi:hypothetical protein
MERIVLLDGPCGGQIHDVGFGLQQVSAVDGDGNRHVYVRTEVVDVSEKVRVVVFRLADPEPAAD